MSHTASWLSQRELAVQLDLTCRQVRNLEKAGLPTNGASRTRKRYPWPEALAWYRDFKRAEVDGRGRSGPRNTMLRFRRLEATAELLEVELAAQRAALLKAERTDAVRDLLGAAPGRHARALSLVIGSTPAEAGVVLSTVVEWILADLDGPDEGEGP